MRYFVAIRDILREQIEAAPENPKEVIATQGDYGWGESEHPLGWVYIRFQNTESLSNNVLVPLSALREVPERVSIMLTFESKAEKERFMGGLSDGWGENHCTLHWKGFFDAATRYHVENEDDDYEYQL